MATCPECDAEIEVDEFEVDKGDQLSCPECGSNLEVTSLSPIELDIAPDDDEEEEEDDDDLDDAARFGFQHEIIHTGELDRADYRANPENRCYFCKTELYTRLSTIAKAR